MGTIYGSWTGTEPKQGSVATGSHCDAIPLSGDLSSIITESYVQSGWIPWIFGCSLHSHLLFAFEVTTLYVASLPRHAGKYDGVLGVLGAIQAVAALRQTVRPPAAVVIHCSLPRCLAWCTVNAMSDVADRYHT